MWVTYNFTWMTAKGQVKKNPGHTHVISVAQRQAVRLLTLWASQWKSVMWCIEKHKPSLCTFNEVTIKVITRAEFSSRCPDTSSGSWHNSFSYNCTKYCSMLLQTHWRLRVMVHYTVHKNYQTTGKRWSHKLSQRISIRKESFIVLELRNKSEKGRILEQLQGCTPLKTCKLCFHK